MAKRQVKINSEEDIQQMREVGAKAAEQLTALIHSDIVKAGVTTEAINDWCYQYTLQQGCTPAPLGYKGANAVPYPKSVCISPNNVVCHGVPSDKKLKKKDILNVDITLKDENSYHADTSVMFQVGKVTPASRNLCEITQFALYEGIKAVRPGANFNQIGKAIEEFITSHHAKVIKKYIGHGINTVFHDEPQVLHYYEPLLKRTMEPGMIFTIEPIVTFGNIFEMNTLADGWTVVAKDRMPSAQWEHTILVTETGYEILTHREGEEIDREG